MIRYDIMNLAKTHLGETYDANNNIFCITDYYGKPMNKRIPYCCMFAWDIYRLAWASKYFYDGKRCASCTKLMNFYKSKYPKWVHKNIDRCKPGDLVLFQFDSDPNADHIGLFDEKVSSKKFSAVEGNTRLGIVGDQSNGGYIAQRVRNIKNVLCFVSIPFDDDKDNPYPVPTRVLKKGCKGDDVKWLQYSLVSFGYGLEIDGSFGKNTENAVCIYQQINNLVVDGLVGPATRNMILSQL